MSFFAGEVRFLQVIPILPPSILEDSRGISTGYLIPEFSNRSFSIEKNGKVCCIITIMEVGCMGQSKVIAMNNITYT